MATARHYLLLFSCLLFLLLLLGLFVFCWSHLMVLSYSIHNKTYFAVKLLQMFHYYHIRNTYEIPISPVNQSIKSKREKLPENFHFCFHSLKLNACCSKGVFPWFRRLVETFFSFSFMENIVAIGTIFHCLKCLKQFVSKYNCSISIVCQWSVTYMRRECVGVS